MVYGRTRAVLLATSLVAAAVAGALNYRAVANDVATARTLEETAYVGSDSCRSCHPDHSESFRRTFHRTMTQEAHEGSVLGRFDGTTLDYFGVRARMSRGPAGEFWITFTAAAGTQTWRATVERCVGSHRYQQYLARDGDVYFRLPIAWDVAEQRFIHMNAAFLTPDPIAPPGGGSIQRADYDRHVTRWNDNCVFCHNVRPNPGLDAQSGVFRTEVAELGVACEACHGPAGDHVARNKSPMRRYLLQVGDRADPTIRNPAHMSGLRSAEVCGRCHGQRLTSDIGRFLRDGDPFVPGEALARWSKPLFRDTTQNGEEGLFAPRFWSDGTARLTAYEFQGYLQSPCTKASEFSCESCHAMHQGDPRGQLHPERVGNAACTQCHSQLSAAPALAAHSRHDPQGSGSSCISCHMPPIVYGLVRVHLSHRIEVPDPAAQQRVGRPDACTLCHTDRSPLWAAGELAAWKGGARLSARPSTTTSTSPTPSPTASTMPSTTTSTAPTAPPTSSTSTSERTADGELPAVTRALFAGDPIERAVAAHALGLDAAPLGPQADARALAMLAEVLESDAYPAVRTIALRSLRMRLVKTRPELSPLLAEYTPALEPDSRTSVLLQLRAALAPSASDSATWAALRKDAERVAIEIGE